MSWTPGAAVDPATVRAALACCPLLVTNLLAPARPDAILIPEKAVQELQGLKTVYVIGADNKASVRQIKATQRLGTDWVLDSGLQAGEIVVVDGLQKVSPGATVKPVFAADRDPADSHRG